MPILVFSLLDGYYLFQERLYRALYDDVRAKSDTGIDFSMDASGFRGEKRTWCAAAFSVTLLFFYGALTATTVAAILFV